MPPSFAYILLGIPSSNISTIVDILRYMEIYYSLSDNQHPINT